MSHLPRAHVIYHTIQYHSCTSLLSGFGIAAARKKWYHSVMQEYRKSSLDILPLTLRVISRFHIPPPPAPEAENCSRERVAGTRKVIRRPAAPRTLSEIVASSGDYCIYGNTLLASTLSGKKSAIPA